MVMDIFTLLYIRSYSVIVLLKILQTFFIFVTTVHAILVTITVVIQTNYCMICFKTNNLLEVYVHKPQWYVLKSALTFFCYDLFLYFVI